MQQIKKTVLRKKTIASFLVLLLALSSPMNLPFEWVLETQAAERRNTPLPDSVSNNDAIDDSYANALKSGITSTPFGRADSDGGIIIDFESDSPGQTYGTVGYDASDITALIKEEESNKFLNINVTNWNAGVIIPIDLGDGMLGDYKEISFDFKLISSSVTYKNLTAYVFDTTPSGGNIIDNEANQVGKAHNIIGSIASTDWSSHIMDLSGLSEDMKGKTGNVYFVIGVHTDGDVTYQLDNISFVPDSEITEIPDTPEWNLELTSLKSVYEDYFLLGNIISDPSRLDDTDTANMFKHHYNALTAENHNKPGYVISADGIYTLDIIQGMANWCNDNNFQYIAHTLVWHSQSSTWLHGTVTAPFTREEAKNRMEAYINEVAGINGIGGSAYSWDVANEVFMPSVTDYSGNWKSHLRTDQSGSEASAWYAAYANGADTDAGESGADFIYDAYVFARQADPNAILYYNDFNDEQVGKSHAIAAMVKELNEKWANDVRNDTPGRLLIEGIGLQSHYNTNISTASVENAIIHYITENPGIRLSISELDITIAGTSEDVKPTQEQYVKQAYMYAELFEIYKKYAVGSANESSNPKVIERVTLWGTDDESSWRSFGQNGGTGGYPTLFDADYNAKESYYAVIDPAGYIAENMIGAIVGKACIPSAIMIY